MEEKKRKIEILKERADEKEWYFSPLLHFPQNQFTTIYFVPTLHKVGHMAQLYSILKYEIAAMYWIVSPQNLHVEALKPMWLILDKQSKRRKLSLNEVVKMGL